MVMYGAQALSFPLHVGQSLHLKPARQKKLFCWEAFYLNRPWFRVVFNSSTLEIVETTDRSKAEKLAGYLKTLDTLSSSFRQELFTWDVETQLEFHPSWGLGSSSTLTALLAEWAELNPLDLHLQISSGSGYDVATAIASGPIVYRIKHDAPQYRHVSFLPAFSDNIFFAWLGRKQNSHESVEHYQSVLDPDHRTIEFFDAMTEGMLHAGNRDEFGDYMTRHEARLSELLNLTPVGKTLFNDLDGYVKSLGAWGGDFVMIVTGRDHESLKEYLEKKKIRVLFNFNELVKHGNVVS